MKVLIITGKSAEEIVRQEAMKIDEEIDVLALPVSVAAFITPKYAINELKKINIEKYEKIIFPGAVNGDLSPVEEAVGIPTFKGPLHATDLRYIFVEEITLSKILPANELYSGFFKNKALKEIKDTEIAWKEVLSKKGGFSISGVHVSEGLPMRILAEIVNAPLLKNEEVIKKAKYYVSAGADLIDIGMLAGSPKPQIIPKIIDTLRETVNVPLSIDTLNPTEIKSALNAGIDLILSLDYGNIHQVTHLIDDEAVVVLPTDMSQGVFPRNVLERVKKMEEIISELEEVGLKKIIGDLVAEPLIKPGLLNALKAFKKFRKRKPEIPLLFGIGNATELIDADSIGVNAVLTALSREAGVNLLHVPEHSVKAKGSVYETVIASRMMFLAERRGSVPKDLGLDLLLFKEKRWREEYYSHKIEEGVKIIQAKTDTNFKPDKSGWFKIQIDREENKIIAIHYLKGEQTPNIIIKGETAEEIYQTINRYELISKHDHAAYLGVELTKAEIALTTGRGYLQDSSLF